MSYCSAFGMVPRALRCIDFLMFLSEHSVCDDELQKNRPSLLASKTRLLLLAYGERFVDPQLKSAMTAYMDTEVTELSYQEIEMLLSLAFLYCRRGQVSS